MFKHFFKVLHSSLSASSVIFNATTFLRKSKWIKHFSFWEKYLSILNGIVLKWYGVQKMFLSSLSQDTAWAHVQGQHIGLVGLHLVFLNMEYTGGCFSLTVLIDQYKSSYKLLYNYCKEIFPYLKFPQHQSLFYIE